MVEAEKIPGFRLHFWQNTGIQVTF